MSIPDPCGIEYGYQRIVAIWVKYIMVGINYYNKDVLRSNTVRGYALAVNTLFRLRGYKPPTDMTDRNNMPGIVINNLIKQEDIASQRAPLDEAIFAEAHRAAKASHSLDSDRHLMFDILTLARYIGPRVSEYAQTNQERVDYHVYPNGTSVIKAFTANDFVFCDDKNNILSFIDESSLTLAAFVRITWRIQKNRQNNQTIQLKADPKNPDICPVRGAIRMVMRARRLSQPDDMPLACCLLQNEKSTTLISYGNSDRHVATRGSQKSPPIHPIGRAQAILCPFPTRLGMRPSRRGRQVSFVYTEALALDGRFFQNVSSRYKCHSE